MRITIYSLCGLALLLTAIAHSPEALSQPGAKHKDGNPSLTNSIGMKLVLIHNGEFSMGSNEPHMPSEDTPHQVRLTKDFYLSAYAITVGQFKAFVKDTGYKTEAETNGNGADGFDSKTATVVHGAEYNWRHPGFEQADDHPVVCVSWNDADAFCKWLSKKEKKTYRLPTEAEFEYSAKAGTTTRFPTGDSYESLLGYANVADLTYVEEMSRLQGKPAPPPPAPGDDYGVAPIHDGYAFTSPVGKFKPNAWGLYDMHGNVWTWCNDWSVNRYKPDAQVDPVGPATEAEGTGGREVRGGAWNISPKRCRSANRVQRAPHQSFCMVGIRVARNAQ